MRTSSDNLAGDHARHDSAEVVGERSKRNGGVWCEQAKADREKARVDLAELKKAKKEQKAKEKALEAEANKKLPK